MGELRQVPKPDEGARPAEGDDGRNSRLSRHLKREHDADAMVSQSLRQRLWSARRTATEVVRPIVGSVLAPLLPYSRVLQKKLQRPTPVRVDYGKHASAEKPLVMHLLANFEIGGTPQLVCDIVEFTQDDYRHLVVSKHVPRPAPYLGVDIVDMPLPLAADGLKALIQKHNPAVVHVHYWNGMQQDFVWYHSVFRVLKDAGIPVVENVNTSGEPYFSDIVNRYVFCSDWSRQASGAPWIPEAVIYPGTRLEDFLRKDLSGVPDNRIGMVYRLGGDKIGPNAIEIFIEVMKALPDSNCVIVGDGDLVHHFKSRVAQENLEDRITFTGWISYAELRKVYQELAVFLAPVKDDTFGSVSVYAMCAGIPVVGFEVGGIPEIVGSADLLAPPGDVAKFAEIVIGLLGDRDRRLRIGADNQRRAEQSFSVGAMTESFGRLYGELIREDRPAAGIARTGATGNHRAV